MSFTIVDCDQRSPEWVAARLGRLTGSRADSMLAAGRGNAESAGRRNLRIQLVLERLNSRSHERGFVSNAMQDGIDREFDARSAYEALTGQLVTQVGFVAHRELMAGGSPDAVIGEWEGLAEIKCPIPATHFEYFRTGVVPLDYRRQIVHLQWLTGVQYCDFFSWNPEFPERGQCKLVRVARNEADIEAYDAAVKTFLGEVDSLYVEFARMVAA